MTKVVINTCYGGFSLSHVATMRYAEIKGIDLMPIEIKGGYGRKSYMRPDRTYFYDRGLERDDPVLVQVIEELGDRADGRFAALAVVEVPDDVNWVIEEDDGWEWVAEIHRTWS